MSGSAKFCNMTLAAPKVWTYEDVRQLPDDGRRYEVIDGVLFVSPSPRSVHQLLSRRLQFFFYQLELEGQGYVYDAPMDLLMPSCTPVQPDLIFLLADQYEMIRETCIEGVPHLLVEILSPDSGSRDRVKKLRKYASNGVCYYLLLDPQAETLEVLHLDGLVYRLEASLEPGDTWEFLGKTLDLGQLFAPLRIPTRETPTTQNPA